jgi:hypothetical protein
MPRRIYTYQPHLATGIWHWSPDVWTAIGTIGLVLVAVVAAAFAYFQLREARRLRREQAQPNVAVFTDDSGHEQHQIDLVIKNFGLTPATDVRVKIDPSPQSANLRGSNAQDYLKVPEVIPTLVPGQEWRCYWDFTQALAAAEDLPREYTATVSFKDSRGNQIKPEFTFLIDWNTLFAQNRLVIHGMNDLASATMEIRDVLKKASGSDGLRVAARDGDKLHDADQKFWRGRRRVHRLESGKQTRIDAVIDKAQRRRGSLKRRFDRWNGPKPESKLDE